MSIDSYLLKDRVYLRLTKSLPEGIKVVGARLLDKQGSRVMEIDFKTRLGPRRIVSYDYDKVLSSL